MKVLWIVLGVLGGLCLICGAGFFFLFSKGKGVFDEAGKFGDQAFTAIAQNWDEATFRSYAAPEIDEQNGKNAIPEMLATLKNKLGPLKGPFSSHLTSIDSKSGIGTTADWNADATFEKGSGEVTMQLISRDGAWKVLKFHVDSPQLTAGSDQTDGETQHPVDPR